MATRPAGKAGPHSWYADDPVDLKKQLQNYLATVPSSIDEVPLPISGARIVIAPHAGYDYSGECAAWAYKTLDLGQAERVFILGPTHTYSFEGCAATTFGKYATPLGDLTIDRETVQTLKDAISAQEVEIEDMPTKNEKSEHSLEMHMPYLYLQCQEAFDSPDHFPKIIPLLIGSTDGNSEKAIGRVLLPYIMDPANAFIISSDFCHWGDKNFGYSVYSPTSNLSDLVRLRRWDPKPWGLPIHETIRAVDEAAMDAVESGDHAAFLHTLRKTQNTVCGRHPIGVMMAALELLGEQPGYEGKGRFKVIQYQRSTLVQEPDDFSVSYVSAYAVV
ncbi:hypothetical protein AK830_g5950 [Neonectria ditissima]|uniref:MEMO1 family protein C4H3.04c n=1 Tax=Neonectria ditissima TaxID=78410 RepID=A0A0P7ASA5_9HYPO|nr:hypothetical protein AK830_g5950 [Neonectria ditissima]